MSVDVWMVVDRSLLTLCTVDYVLVGCLCVLSVAEGVTGCGTMFEMGFVVCCVLCLMFVGLLWLCMLCCVLCVVSRVPCVVCFVVCGCVAFVLCRDCLIGVCLSRFCC